MQLDLAKSEVSDRHRMQEHLDQVSEQFRIQEREFRAENSALQSQLAEATGKVAKEVGDQERHNQQSELMKQEQDVMSAKLVSLQHEITDYVAQLNQTQLKLTEQQVENDTVRQELALLCVDRDQLSAQLVAVQTQPLLQPDSGQQDQQQLQELQQLEQKHQADKADMQLQVQGLQHGQQQLEAQCVAMQQQLADSKRELQESLATQQTLLADNESLRSQQTGQMNPAAPIQQVGNDSDVKAQFTQLQFRLKAVEEEKAVMLADMRKHLFQLARDNHDLKQRSPASALTPAQQSEVVDVPAQSTMSAPPSAESETVVVQTQHAVGATSGGWLSYVSSPFLLGSDQRDQQAESRLRESLRGQALVLT